MSDRYDFANLSPIEFESLCVDLIEAETSLRFERFSEGADEGIDGRHSRANGDVIIQAKHYKNSTWSDLRKAIENEKRHLATLNPLKYYLFTSQPLTPQRKQSIVSILNHPSVTASTIWGRTELNACLAKHTEVEKRNIKLWLSSTAVLERLLTNDIAVFTEATYDEIERILKVYVVNPSLKKSTKILDQRHCLIVSGAPGVGKTTLAQVLAAEYIDGGWELVSISSIEEGRRAFRRNCRQVFVFDDFLGKIRLDPTSLAQDDEKIVRFMSMIGKDQVKRFILTTRSYILQTAQTLSEALDDTTVTVSEMVLDLATYTRELRARILYNHLYHSTIDQASIQALLVGDTVRLIVDHRNYMPRIIQWMTDEFRHRGISPVDYPILFLEALENPNKIWDKAFTQHISHKAQILLYCMYCIAQDNNSGSIVDFDRLRVFFEMAIIKFRVINQEYLRANTFEETLREIKSSFIVINDKQLNFINPSVQDYLSQKIIDATVISTLALSVTTISIAEVLWRKIVSNLCEKLRETVANTLLQALISGHLEGRRPLREIVYFIGDLILESNNIEYCSKLRKLEMKNLFWTYESEFPTLIQELDCGKYCHLPYARTYARYLRRELFKHVSNREYIIELEDLAELLSNLDSSKMEMSDLFYSNFSEAVEEAVDRLDVDQIAPDQDAEQMISEWLTHIDTIENLASIQLPSWKKREFEERIFEIQQLGEQYSPGPPFWSSVSPAAAVESFSDADLHSMFSSLKKTD